jgi:hypothetical protein
MTTDDLPDNQEDREVYLREHNAANFIEAVTNGHRDSIDTVVMTVKAFAGEPDVLYVALDYAYHSGMAVTTSMPRGHQRLDQPPHPLGSTRGSQSPGPLTGNRGGSTFV